MSSLNQSIISKYEKNKGEIPVEKRQALLSFIKRSRFLSAVKIATVLNVQPQTVRCWLMEDNPRNISTEHLKTLCDFYSVDINGGYE